MWVIDIRHWLNEEQTGPAVPELKFKLKKITELITFITSLDTGVVVRDPPVCWRRPGRKPCKTELNLGWADDGRIYWRCPKCGDEGIIDGWQGLMWDMTVFKGENFVVH